MGLFEVSIMTPDSILFNSNQVKEVVLPTTTGRMGILANHAPVVTGLDIGVMLVSQPDSSNWKSIAVLGGFALIKENKVRIVVSEAKFGSDINSTEAETIFVKAQEDLGKADGKKEKIELTLALKRARARYEASLKAA